MREALNYLTLPPFSLNVNACTERPENVVYSLEQNLKQKKKNKKKLLSFFF